MSPPPPGQTQLPDWDGLKLQVRTLIASHRVMIFSKSYCPYCNKVRGRRESPRRALLRGPSARARSRRNGGRGGAVGAASPRFAERRRQAWWGERHVPWGRPLARLAARPGPGEVRKWKRAGKQALRGCCFLRRHPWGLERAGVVPYPPRWS